MTHWLGHSPTQLESRRQCPSAGFVAPLVCERLPVRLVVLVAPMIPAPGEAPADYWSDTRYADEPREHRLEAYISELD